jgi:hypothetical protein
MQANSSWIGYRPLRTLRLVEAARTQGIPSLSAFVLPDNLRMLSHLCDLNLPKRVHHRSGVECVEVALDTPAPARSRDLIERTPARSSITA